MFIRFLVKFYLQQNVLGQFQATMKKVLKILFLITVEVKKRLYFLEQKNYFENKSYTGGTTKDFHKPLG